MNIYLAPSVAPVINSTSTAGSATFDWSNVPCQNRNGKIAGYELSRCLFINELEGCVNNTRTTKNFFHITGQIPRALLFLYVSAYSIGNNGILLNGPTREAIAFIKPFEG